MDELEIGRVKRNIRRMIDQGASEAEIDSYVAAEGATPETLGGKRPDITIRPAAAEPAAMPALSTPPAPVERPMRAAVQGAGRGLANLVGMPFDLGAAGLNLGAAALDFGSRKMGGPELGVHFAPPSDTIANAASRIAEAFGADVMDPAKMSAREKTAYNVNNFGAQAAAGGAGLIRAAAKRAPEILAGTMPRFGDAFLRPYMGDQVGKTVVGDVFGAAGAGAGVSAAEHFMPDSPLAQLGGALIGGVGGVTGKEILASSLRGAAEAAGRPFGANIDKSINVDPATKMPVTKKVSDRASAVVQNAAADPASVQGYVRGNQAALGDYLPEMPTAMQMSEDPGLAILDRQIAMKNPGPEAARQRRFQSGVRDAVDKTVPEGADPADLIAAAQREADTRTGAADARVERVQKRTDQLGGIRAAHGAEVSDYKGQQVPASQDLHTSLVESGYKPARAAKNEAFKQIDPDRTQIIDAAPLVEAAAKVRDSINKLGPQKDQLPAEFIQRIEALAPESGGEARAVLGDVADMRKYLSTAHEQARRTGNFSLADNIAVLRKAINQTIGASPEAAAANRQYKDFANVYRVDFTDEASKFAREIDRGMNPQPSQTASRFLQPNRPEKSESLRRVIGSLPAPEDAQLSVRRYLLADLAERGAVDAKTGALKPDVIAAWQQKHAANIDLVPGFRAEIDEMTTRGQKGERIASAFETRLKDAQKAAKRTQAEIDKGALGLVLGADPDKAMHAVMSQPHRSGRLLDELIKLTEGDEPARRGLRAALHNYIIDKATTTAVEKMRPGDRRGPVSSAKLSQIFNEHEQDLARVFDPEDMNGLRAGHRALELVNIERLRIGSGSDTVEKTAMFDKLMQTPLGKGIDGALRLKYGMLRGGGLMAIARRQMAGLTDKTAEDVARLVERAREDPEVLILLSGRKLPVGSPAWNAKMNRLLGLAGAAREVNDDE